MSAKKLLPLAARGELAHRYKFNESVTMRIYLERLRQKHLLREEIIKYDLASPIVSNDRKLRVTTEENGEVARAIDGIENAAGPKEIFKAKKHLQEELTQIVACGIAWLEALEEELK